MEVKGSLLIKKQLRRIEVLRCWVRADGTQIPLGLNVTNYLLWLSYAEMIKEELVLSLLTLLGIAIHALLSETIALRETVMETIKRKVNTVIIESGIPK